MVLLKRGDEVMIAEGGTALHEGDHLVVLPDEEVLPRLRATDRGRGVRGRRRGGTGRTPRREAGACCS